MTTKEMSICPFVEVMGRNSIAAVQIQGPAAFLA